jgi:predicted dehydrogenase
MVFGVQHLRITGTKGSLRWWFLDPTVYVLRTGHIIDNIRADIYDSFFGNNAEMGSFHNAPRNGTGERISTEIYKTHSFFPPFLGVLEEYCEAGNSGRMTVPCP